MGLDLGGAGDHGERLSLLIDEKAIDYAMLRCKIPIVGLQTVAPATIKSFMRIFHEKDAQESLTKVAKYVYFLRGVG